MSATRNACLRMVSSCRERQRESHAASCVRFYVLCDSGEGSAKLAFPLRTIAFVSEGEHEASQGTKRGETGRGDDEEVSPLPLSTTSREQPRLSNSCSLSLPLALSLDSLPLSPAPLAKGVIGDIVTLREKTKESLSFTARARERGERRREIVF